MSLYRILGINSRELRFQLTREEVDLVKSQNATSRNGSFFEGQDGGRRKMPYAFTVIIFTMAASTAI